MSQAIQTIDDASIDAEIFKSTGVVLLDFWAPWCAPCKALAPLLDELAKDYAGEVRIAKINADENEASMQLLNVRSLPTLIIFADGVEKERCLGSISKSRLASMFDKHLGEQA